MHGCLQLYKFMWIPGHPIRCQMDGFDGLVDVKTGLDYAFEEKQIELICIIVLAIVSLYWHLDYRLCT